MKVVAFAGGVGGARMAHGFAQALPPEDLTVLVNIGDDFEHFGLKICPDLDTVCYTLAGHANPSMGWGRKGETWGALQVIEQLGGPTWFRLGDQDLGLHLERTRRMTEGQTLSQVTHDICRSWGVNVRVLPVTDDPVPTQVETLEGELSFQDYFVRLACQPIVKSFHFIGVENAHPAPLVLEALDEADAVVFCPSNPWVSLDPILAVPGVLTHLLDRCSNGCPLVVISPIIGGKTVKGPAAKMFAELGIVPSALAVAEHYHDSLKSCFTGFVLDRVDELLEPAIAESGVRILTTNTLMADELDRKRLAGEVIAFIHNLINGLQA